MSDEELDKVFREASEGIDFPPDNQAWKAMSAKLDQRPVVAPFWSKTKISMTVASGILLMALVWYFNSDPEKIEIVRNQDTSEIDQAKEKSSAIPSDISALSSKSEEEVSAKSESTNATDRQNGDNQNAVEGLSVQATNLVNRANRNKINKYDRQGSVNSVGKNGSVSDIKEDTDSKQAVNNESNSVLSEKSEHKSLSDFKIEEQATEIKEVKEEIGNKDSGMMDTSDEPEKSQEKTSNPKVFSIKLAVAPDFSTVKFSSFESPGFNYGLLLGYNFNSRLSVYTGALSSRKIYSSTGGGNYSTGYNDYPIKRIDGNCGIIDIPVNFYYTVSSKQSISIKLGLGVSSYLMLDEAYAYVLDKQYGDDTYTQNIVNKNQEWFKVANVSVILEKQLSNRMFIELEPFVKAPMAGIGEGKVSLVSLGAFLNLRYDISLK